MKVYVSGPMTGLPEFNFPAFNAAEQRLRAVDLDVENPASKGILDDWSWEDYLRYDIRVLMDCQGIYLLEGWMSSRGARLEAQIARELGFNLLMDDENMHVVPTYWRECLVVPFRSGIHADT